MLKRVFLFFVLLQQCIGNLAYAQEVFSDVISSLNHEFSEAEIDELEDLCENPIAINNADFSEYEAFFFLTEFQKKSLFYFVQKNRPIRTIYELQYVLGMQKDKVLLLAKVCSLTYTKKPPTWKEILHLGKHIYSNVNSWYPVSHKDYAEQTNYSGAAVKSVHRYRFSSYKKLLWGLTLKNDMGEPTQKGALSPTFDYYSFYFQINGLGKFSAICIGDYEIKIGQGLAFYQGGFYGKYMAASPLKSQKIIKAHSSTNEFSFNRGLAFTYEFSKVKISPFFSRKRVSGKISPNKLTLNETGYHRTKSELQNRKALTHLVVGNVISFEINNFANDFLFVHQRFSDSSHKFLTSHFSWSYMYTKPKLIFYGESAIDRNTKTALLHGMDYIFSEQIHFSALLRKYDDGYQNSTAQSFAEQSSTGNEIGAFLKVNFQQSKHNYTFALDLYSFPSTKEFGRQTYGTYSYNSYDKWKFSGNLTHEKKAGSRQFRIKCVNQYLLQPFTLKTTFSCGNYSEDKLREQGFYIQQECFWTIKNKLLLTLGIACFDAPYNTRLYVWEQNVQYGIRSSQILYEGVKVNANFLWNISEKLKIECNFQHSKYSDKYELPEYYAIFGENQKITFSTNFTWRF